MPTGKSKTTRTSSFMRTARRLITGKNRNYVLAGLLASVLVVTGLFSLALQSDSTPVDLTAQTDPNETEVAPLDTADQLSAVVAISEGTVEFKDESDWQPLSTDDELASGMSVRTTGAASRVSIELGDKSIVRIDASSEIMFESLTEARVVIIQESGYAYHRVAPSSERDYVVQTENAQYQSVGTAFRTAATGDEESVEVFHSDVREVTSNLEATQGEKIVIRSFANPERNETVEKLDLQNIKEDRFITWNRQLDKDSEDYSDLLGFLADYDGPRLTIIEPAAGSSVSVEAGTSQGSVEIKGTTERSTALTVQSKSIAGSSPVDVTVREDGAFTTPTLKGPIGSAVFEFVATDRAGNRTIERVSYVFEREVVLQEEGIVLTLEDSADNPQLAWGLVGITSPDGVYVLRSDSGSTPSFPDDQVSLVSSVTTFAIDQSSLADGTVYNFSVCRYIKATDSCDTLSNSVSFQKQ